MIENAIVNIMIAAYAVFLVLGLHQVYLSIVDYLT